VQQDGKELMSWNHKQIREWSELPFYAKGGPQLKATDGVPTLRRASSEVPYAMARGYHRANNVIIAAGNTDARPPSPLRACSCFSLTKCTIRMPFLAASPIRTTMPIWP